MQVDEKLFMSTNRPWHSRQSAMPRDIIWQLSALIGVQQGGRQIQALYQAYKGALSGSHSIFACPPHARAHTPASTPVLLCQRGWCIRPPLRKCTPPLVPLQCPFSLLSIWPRVCVCLPKHVCCLPLMKCSELLMKRDFKCWLRHFIAPRDKEKEGVMERQINTHHATYPPAFSSR